MLRQIRATKPSAGIYYAIPKDKSMTLWEIVSEREDESTETPLHWNIWQNTVLPKLKERFNIDIKTLQSYYTGLPRGRVLKLDSGNYTILHGNDTPSAVNHLILAEFGLLALNYEKKVNFSFDSHEQMKEVDKDVVWNKIKN